jgi:hypothetical protein
VKWLERTLGMGVQSKLFDALSLLLIAMLRFDRGDASGVVAMREQLRRYRERFPDSKRLRRFEQAASALVALLGAPANPAPETLAALRDLAGLAGSDDFDLEAANIVLALWARAPAALCPADEHAAVVERIGMRFCVSKAIGEVLLASARRAAPAVGVIRHCQARVGALAEQAMELSLAGQTAKAVQALLEAGETTLNAKLLEMAGVIARRNAATLSAETQAAAASASALLRRSCQAVNHIAGIQRSGRSPGGLQVRGNNSPERVHAAA